MLDVGK